MDLFEYQGKQYFARYDIPVSAGDVALTVDEAVSAAEAAGYPVVVKPLSGNHGRGVAINLRTADEVETGFEKAGEHGRTIVVESYIEGFDHRLLVIDGELVAAAKRVPGHVVGDGVDLYGSVWFAWWIQDCILELRDPEIHDPDLVVFGDQDVLGLEVAVDDAGLVDGGQAGGRLERDLA